jgi:hypothetical protein
LPLAESVNPKAIPLKDLAQIIYSIEMAPTCSKCSAPLDTTGYPLWCLACRAKHKREYEATKKEMTESRSFAAGCTAMREYLAKRFAEYGAAGSFSGAEVAGYIMQAKGPV